MFHPSFFWPSSGPTPIGPCCCCADDSKAGCSTPGGVSQKPSRVGRIGSLQLPVKLFMTQPRTWLSESQAHNPSSCSAFHSLVPRSSSQQSCSQTNPSPACIDSGSCPDPDAGLFTWPCCTCADSRELLSLSRSLWMASDSPDLSTLPLSFTI